MPTVSTHKAMDLAPSVRAAVEHLLGRPLGHDEEITISAGPAQQAVAEPDKRAEIVRDLEALLDRREALLKRNSADSALPAAEPVRRRA